jgi:hypothetical protein
MQARSFRYRSTSPSMLVSGGTNLQTRLIGLRGTAVSRRSYHPGYILFQHTLLLRYKGRSVLVLPQDNMVTVFITDLNPKSLLRQLNLLREGTLRAVLSRSALPLHEMERETEGEVRLENGFHAILYQYQRAAPYIPLFQFSWRPGGSTILTCLVRPIPDRAAAQPDVQHRCSE